MVQKSYEVLEEFSVSKHDVHLPKIQAKCIKLLKKGDVFEPKNLINNNLDSLTSPLTRDKHHAVSVTVFRTLKVAKSLGIIREIDDKPISFNDFCSLDYIFRRHYRKCFA